MTLSPEQIKLLEAVPGWREFCAIPDDKLETTELKIYAPTPPEHAQAITRAMKAYWRLTQGGGHWVIRENCSVEGSAVVLRDINNQEVACYGAEPTTRGYRLKRLAPV